ncbi:hypothetical protein L1987_12573 [Smallanthus sonchifolius]|uniref:Uncharacterized protein n=1 Tax=Smallanthus sonchifolius TaxID=185202 RepID=A0ACB9JGB2_9ASTR|nr:hypothetical protein L1987_12573 [Smallanthus sonchifolius]
MPDATYGPHPHPRPLATHETPDVLEDYRLAAINAIEAYGINDKTDEYGGSLANRCKFLLQVVQAVAAAFGADRVGTHQNEEQVAELIKTWRGAYVEISICSGGYTRELGLEAVAHGDADLVAYGQHFIMNPDLVLMLKLNAPLNWYVRATFYIHGLVIGYINYPSLEKESERPSRL